MELHWSREFRVLARLARITVSVAVCALLAGCSGEHRPAGAHGAASGDAASVASAAGTDTRRKVRIVTVASIPDVSSLPYPDALTEWLVQPVLPTEAPPARFVVRVWGMRGHKLTEAAARQAGDAINLAMVPLENAPEEVRQAARFSINDPNLELIDLPVWWGEPR